MGGVVVQLDSLESVLGPSSLQSGEIWEAWILSDAVQEYEQGRCTVESFAARLIDELELQGTAEQFIERFRRFPMGLFPGAAELVASVEPVTTAILSNTNELHWTQQKDHETISRLCDRSYLSYELGLVKPHRAIYDHVIADLGLPATRILFLDDNQVNVDGARGAGMRSEIAKGPQQAEQVLRSYGVID